MAQAFAEAAGEALKTLRDGTSREQHADASQPSQADAGVMPAAPPPPPPQPAVFASRSMTALSPAALRTRSGKSPNKAASVAWGASAIEPTPALAMVSPPEAVSGPAGDGGGGVIDGYYYGSLIRGGNLLPGHRMRARSRDRSCGFSPPERSCTTLFMAFVFASLACHEWLRLHLLL